MSRRHRQLTYYAPPPAEEAPRPRPAARDGILHGWTLPEIHDLARKAAMANRWLVSDFTIRYEAAWDGIIDELLAAKERPSGHDLAAAGKGAVSRGLLKDYSRTHGVANRDLAAGAGSAPRFAAYWFERDGEGFDERVAERVALGQVMAAVGARHAGFLEALAAAPDTRSAAEALGISRGSFSAYVSQARDAFEALWYAPETPPRGRRSQSRYAPGAVNEARLAPCGTPGAYRRHKSRGDQCGDPEACAAAYRAHERARKGEGWPLSGTVTAGERACSSCGGTGPAAGFIPDRKWVNWEVIPGSFVCRDAGACYSRCFPGPGPVVHGDGEAGELPPPAPYYTAEEIALFRSLPAVRRDDEQTADLFILVDVPRPEHPPGCRHCQLVYPPGGGPAAPGGLVPCRLHREPLPPVPEEPRR
jgi:hypothetical protein